MSDVDPRGIMTASLSAVGRVRSHNEDYCSEFQQPAGHRLLVVADGMGGHRGGATASRTAVETIGEVFSRSTSEPVTALREAFSAANENVYRMASEHPELRGMGTTAVSLLFSADGNAWVAHVGDSRAYRLRLGKMEPLTADHSVVAEMQRQGLITSQEAAVHPRRNEIMRSVGVEPDVEPDVTHVGIEPGDRFLLCSDGLSGLVADEEIAAVVQREPPSQAVKTLVDTANSRGGIDNVTVQIAAVPGGISTAVDTAPQVRGTAWLDRDEIESDRQRLVRRIALVTALVAGLLAVALFWLLYTGGDQTFGARGAEGLDASASSPVLASSPPVDRLDPAPPRRAG